ncbi:sensor histidine kinase [Caldimonas aquatica]|uniref:Sensor histidine kinase n=1 Tax=Caldimonas aquatica TaxID=376175 RepID=A0ABY6MRP6_9BURK|nr:sensor histidine kinase [Schlegelella aquatica]UZD54683.1 sensor histidine kinase [Schlegelella aquatica]
MNEPSRPLPPASDPGGERPGLARSRWQQFLARLRKAQAEIEAAAARSGRVPAQILRRLAVLKLSLPLTLLLGAAMLWMTERGYQRIDESYAALKNSRQVLQELNNLSFLAARVDATQAEYILTGSPESLARHRAASQEVVQAHARLAAMGGWSGGGSDAAVVARYVEAERQEVERLDQARAAAPPGDVRNVQLHPNPVSDGALREALGALVARERQRLASAEAAASAELRRQRWLTLGAIAAGVGLLVLLLQTYRAELDAELRMGQRLQEERDRLEREVRQRTRELSELATHLQHLAEQEKSRLARELHDELGAILTASKMDVGMLLRKQLEPREWALASLKRLQDTLERGVQLKRRVIEGLVPTALRNLGLVAALEALADEVESLGALQIERELPEDLTLDAERSIAIYRLVQEALTNVQKHAQARRVELHLHSDGQRLHLRVRDDGVGLGAGSRAKLKSHGLRGMKHRVDAFHGSFHIGPAPGGGTELRVALPLQDVAEEEAPGSEG